jgi:YgiT-type zinc finger domain-containing protein
MASERRFEAAFEICPVCGGELVEKRVEKLLRGGTNMATITVDAMVCLRCGERYYPVETVRRFENIRISLARDQTDGLQLVGGAYEAR